MTGQPEILHKAVRTAIAMPVAFGVVIAGFGHSDLAVFAAFASFATSAFADFGGPLGPRLRAYVVMLTATVAMVALGTLLSSSPVAGSLVMAVVAFGATAVAVFGGYFSAATSTVVLAYVLPVTLPAGPGAVAGRVGAWTFGFACAVVVGALLWSEREGAAYVSRTADACDSVARLVSSGLADADQMARAKEALGEARSGFLSSPGRKAGPSRHDLALLYVLDDLVRCRLLLQRLPDPAAAAEAAPEATARLRTAVARSLHASARALRGEAAPDDPAELAASRDAHLLAIEDPIRPVLEAGDQGAAVRILEDTFVDRLLSTVALSVAVHVAALKVRTPVPALFGVTDPVPWPSFWTRARSLLASHMRPGAVGFDNSLRAAVALGAAVAVAFAAGLGHAFWVGLGALSVLRSDALGTGRSALQAVGGTVLGFAVVAPLVLAAAPAGVVPLWLLLPPLVFLSAYAPNAIGFVVGQAAFTLLVVVLFNIVTPSGPVVGLVRIEDVVVGALVSAVVGLLLWPRGAHGQVRAAVADLDRVAASYLKAAVAKAIGIAGDDPMTCRARVTAAVRRANLAVITARGERRRPAGIVADPSSLLGASVPVRNASDAILHIAAAGYARMGCEPCAHVIEQEAQSCAGNLTRIAALLDGADPPAASPPLGDAHGALCDCFAELAGTDEIAPAIGMVWTHAWLDRLDTWIGHELDATRARLAEA